MIAERVAAKASQWASEFFSDHGTLAKGTKGATALAVAPLAYATQPSTAECTIGKGITVRCHPGTETCTGETGCHAPGSTKCGCAFHYSGQSCCDGYTAFCCSLPGGSNYRCPKNAFVGGWWQCACYSGSGLCSTQNVRYYVDCNVCETSECPHGCECANGKCGERRTCCNNFRYANCNVGKHEPHCKGFVVCRLVTCIPPYKIPCLKCRNVTPLGRFDNCTCHHEAPCL
jgi:hypothetical protein